MRVSSIFRQILLMGVFFSFITAQANTPLIQEKKERKLSMIQAWLQFRYPGCVGRAESFANAAIFEFLEPLSELAQSADCRGAARTSPNCFGKIDDVLNDDYPERARVAGCEESPDYKKFVENRKNPPPKRYTASVVCKEKGKMNRQTGGQWCKQRVDCPDFKMYGKDYDKGEYDFYCEPGENGACTRSFISCGVKHLQNIGWISNGPMQATGYTEGAQ